MGLPKCARLVAVAFAIAGFAGTLGAPGANAAESVRFHPASDTSVDAAEPTSTAGARRTLLATDASPVRVAFLRFDLTGLTGWYARARLELNWASSRPVVRVVHETSADIDEATLTYATAPAVGSPLASTLPQASQYTGVDVTDYLRRVCGHASSCSVGFAVTTTDAVRASFHSRESSRPPRLVVDQVPPPTLSIAVGPDFSDVEAAGEGCHTLTLSSTDPSVDDDNVRVDWHTTALSATSPDDFVGATGTALLDFGDAQTVDVCIPWVDDRIPEPDESYAFWIAGAESASGRPVEIGDAVQIATIVDDDG